MNVWQIPAVSTPIAQILWGRSRAHAILDLLETDCFVQVCFIGCMKVLQFS